LRTAAWIAFGVCLATTLTVAQDMQSARVTITPRTVAPRSPARGGASIRVDTSIVLVPVTVTDPFGAPYPGLTRDSFRLLENGVEQDLKYFATEDAPVSLGVVFDASRSMEGKLDRSRAAVSRFFHTAVPGDEFSLVEFNDAPRLLCGFTSDTALIEKSLEEIEARNWTALLDAVYMAINQMKHAQNPRKALLILSDGGDNNSRYTETEIKNIVREADVSVYSIGLFGNGPLAKHNAKLLRDLSEETGGRMWQVDKMTDLPDAVAKISRAIRNQYLLGFSSSNPKRDGMYRKIQVKLKLGPDAPPLAASWRTGYYAPDSE
jgi:Ca-activated chloride channel family protein